MSSQWIDSGRDVRRTFLLAGVVLVMAAAVRILAAGSDLWLDEVWSLSTAASLRAPWQVFTALDSTNNHFLNTLWLWWAGSDASPYWMRLPSVLLGTGTVALAGLLGSRHSPREGLFAMLLVAGSYLMIDASSEARGYAPMGFFVLLGWFALEVSAPGAEREGGLWPGVFVACVVIGSLFQLAFVIAYAALAAGWLVQRFQRGTGSRRWIRDGLSWHGVPLVFYAALYLFWVRDVAIGGDPLPIRFILERTAMLAVGIEGHATALRWGSGIALVTLALGLLVLAKRDLPRAAMGLVGVVLAPLFLVNWLDPSFLAPRYFGASILLFLLVAAALLDGLAGRGSAGRWAAAVLVTLFLVTNLSTAGPLLLEGRGEYARALQRMDRETASGPLEIGVRLQFRHGMMLDYFAERAIPQRPVRLVAQENWPRRGPEWLVVSAVRKGEEFGDQMTGPRGNLYHRVDVFDGVPGREPAFTLYRVARESRSVRPR